MVRIESHLTEEEVSIIEQIAKEEGRSRKKQCEVFLRKMIADYKHKLTGKYYNDQKGEILELPNWIISDLRFKNELQAIKDRGGITIRVNRLNSTNQNGHTYINKKDRTHPSETALDDATFDYIIDNN